MKKYLIVPDLHGRIDVFMKAYTFAQENDAVLVCLGDYVESFDIGRKKQLELVKTLMNVYEEDKTIYLIGNHDLHYMPAVNQGNPFRASGYSSNFHHDVNSLYMNMVKSGMLRMYYTFENYLCTHAGLSYNVLNKLDASLQLHTATIDDIQNVLSKNEDDMFYHMMSNAQRNFNVACLFDVGFGSGGFKEQGGIFWLRPQEFNIKPINKNFIQIVGHTPWFPPDVFPTDRELDEPFFFRNSIYYTDCLGKSTKLLYWTEETGMTQINLK